MLLKMHLLVFFLRPGKRSFQSLDCGATFLIPSRTWKQVGHFELLKSFFCLKLAWLKYEVDSERKKIVER